jgi:hypothetical protein
MKMEGNEDDDDDPELDTDADSSISRVAHKMADKYVIDYSLKAADDVGQHSGPGYLPNGAAQRAVYNRPVVFRLVSFVWCFDGRDLRRSNLHSDRFTHYLF